MLGKLLGVATLGNTLASVGLMHRFLSGVTKIIILAIVSGFMFCALLTTGFIVSYFSLIHYGLDPYVAALTLGAVAFFFTAILVIVTVDQIRQFRDLPHLGLSQLRDDFPDVRHIVKAFVSGFLCREKGKA